MLSKINVIKIILLIAFVAVLIVAVGVGAYQAGHNSRMTEGAESVSNIFVDLNGDGRLDLLISGAAVLNAGPLSATSTPKPAK